MARLGRSQPFKPLIQRPLAMRARGFSLSESVVVTDSISRTFSRALSEVVTIVDSVAKTMNRALTEVIHIYDGWGKALSFDGVNDFVQAPSSFILPTTGFSIEFWFNPSAFTTNARVIDQSEAGPTNGFNCVITATNRLQATFWNSTTAVASLVTNVLTTGEIHHIGITFDGTISKLYVDGAFVVQDTSSAMTVSAQTFTVGRRSTGSSNFGNFVIDELRVYFSELSAATIANHAINRFEDDSTLKLYWTFNELAGTNIFDKSENGNTGTLFPNAVTGPQRVDSFIPKNLTYASGLLLGATKALGEVVTVIDSAIRDSSRFLTETIALVDSLIRIPGKVLDEVVVIVDTCVPAFTLFLNEVTTIVDTVAKTMERALSEAISIVSDMLREPGKSLVETVSVIEDSFTRAITKVFTVTIIITDAFSLSKLARGLIRGLSRLTNTLMGTSSNKSVQRGTSTSTNTKRGTHL